MKVCRLAITLALLLSAATASVLLIFNPPKQCPGWHLRDGASTSLWLFLAGWTAPVLAYNCAIVLRWDWFVRKFVESDSTMPAEYILTRMCVLGCGFSGSALLYHCQMYTILNDPLFLDGRIITSCWLNSLRRSAHDIVAPARNVSCWHL